MWLIGAMVCLLAALWVQLSVIAGNGWPHNALRHHWFMTISCHFRDCTALLVTSLTHVSGAIASVPTFTFFYLLQFSPAKLFTTPSPQSEGDIVLFVCSFICSSVTNVYLSGLSRLHSADEDAVSWLTNYGK